MTLKRLPISVAKQVTERHDFDSVIVIGFKAGEGYSGCSYGTTKANCHETGLTLDEIGAAMDKGVVAFPELHPAPTRASEPSLLPPKTDAMRNL